MTTVNNVHRYLTTNYSIINSFFLKVIVLMSLFTTAGFVSGVPSGLVVGNDKGMVAIQVVAASFVSSSVSQKEGFQPSRLVLTLPTVIRKCDNITSFLENTDLRLEKKNHNTRREEVIFGVHTNFSLIDVFISERYHLVRPFLPFDNLSHEILPSEPAALHFTEFVTAMYDGLERGLKWADDFAVKVEETIMQEFGSFYLWTWHYKVHDLYPNVFNHYITNRLIGLVHSFKVKTEKIKRHHIVVSVTTVLIDLPSMFNTNMIVSLVLLCLVFHLIIAVIFWKKIKYVLCSRTESESGSPPLALPTSGQVDDSLPTPPPQEIFDEDEPEANMMKINNWQIVKFPLTASSRRSNNVFHNKELLHFERHELCIRISKDHLHRTASLYKNYPGKNFLAARKVDRHLAFFVRARRGRCASLYGLTMDPIIEEEEEDAIESSPPEYRLVVEQEGLGVNYSSFDNVAYDTNHEEERKEKVRKDYHCVQYNNDNVCIADEVRNTAASTPIVEDVPQSISYSFPTPHKEVVGTDDPSVQVQGEGQEVASGENSVKTCLGSGFYIDCMGRKRRFSHRLLLEKKSVEDKKKERKKR